MGQEVGQDVTGNGEENEETENMSLKAIHDQARFRKKAIAAAKKFLGDEIMEFPHNGPDSAYEDDGNLHVCKHGLRICFGIGEDVPGKEFNQKVVQILTALSMKRHITIRALTEEECGECDGEGHTTCNEGHEHDCGCCDGTGLIDPSLEELLPKKPKARKA